MASKPVITLYDVPSHLDGKAWSPNMWKARYALNFKGIPHRTIWLEYPEIEPTMRSIGALPTSTKPNGKPHYTLPVIVDPSRPSPSGGPTVVSESFLIAEYLDGAYPTPRPLFPDGTKALQKLFTDNFLTTAMAPARPIFLPVMISYLYEGSRPYWRQTREAALGGTKLEDLCPKGTPEYHEVWLNIQKGMSSLAALLDKNGSDANTLVMGTRLTFADFVIASYLETFFLATPEEWHARFCTWDGGRWEKLRNICAEWRGVS